MSDKKECFIIMPITTPESMIEIYRDGKEHFKHVLNCLFKPAIEKAGYIPKPPIAEGSDLIQAEIIKNLETADIVLCDMSCLNPNVFFEFGIRTSLNKPVCIVKDELTTSVPFDPSILNHKEYNSALEPWHLENEINILSAHLTASLDRSKGENTLWKYFGMKSEAAHYKVTEGSDSKLEYITFQMDSLREKVDQLTAPSEKPEYGLPYRYKKDLLVLSDLRLEMRKILNNDNMPSQRKVEYLQKLDSRFRKISQHLIDAELPGIYREKLENMIKEVAQLMHAYYVQNKPDDDDLISPGDGTM